MAGREEELLSVDAEANAPLIGHVQDAADCAHRGSDNHGAHTGNCGCGTPTYFARPVYPVDSIWTFHAALRPTM